MMVRFAIAAGTYLISFVFWLLEWYYMLIFATSILLSQEDIRKAHQSTPRERPSYWRPHEEQRTRLGLRAEPCVGVQSFCQEFRTRIQWAKNAVSSEEKIFEKILAFIDQLENETAEHGIPEVGGLSSFLRLLMDNIKNVEDVTMKAQALDNLRALSTLFPYMLGLVRFKQETKTQLISKLSDLRVTHHEHGELQGHQVIQSANDSRLYPFWYNAQTNSRKLLILLNTTFASFGSTYKTPHLIRKSVKSLYTFAHCLLYSHRSSQMSRAICDDKLFDVNMIQYIWCLPDNIIPMKWMQRYTLPSVAISQQFDIPSRANGPLKGANVKARLISSKAIPGFVYPFQNLQREVSGREMPLIMHMHGGGFISGSTNMHENYLREWAIITGYPIVSIDYSLAPQQKYPTQLNECFEAYRWLRKTNCLGFKISELIVVGDSAGGNLATAMCYKCTTEDIIAPDALVLHYPALDLSNTPHASRVLFMDDPVVPFPAVTKCRDAYLGPTEELDSDLYLDPFVSPSFGTDKMIEGLPNSVHIYAAEYDPLADEAIHFAERLMNAKKEVHFGCHQNMPHGYLTLARYTPDAVKLVQDHGHMLAEIVQSLRKKAQTAS